MSNNQLAIVAGVLVVFIALVCYTKFVRVDHNPQLQGQQGQEWNNWPEPQLGEPQPIEPAPPAIPDGPRMSPRNYREAVEESQRTGKHIFLFFEKDNCDWCDKMKEHTFSNAEVRNKLSDYVVYFCNIKDDRVLTNRYKVASVPAYFVVDKHQKMLHKGIGYKDAKGFLNWLN